MSILQIGVPKSGNLWLWKIIEEILKQKGFERKSYIRTQPIYSFANQWCGFFSNSHDVDFLELTPKRCFYLIPPVFRMPITDIDSYINNSSHVWSQSAYHDDLRHILSKFKKIIYIIRDPRDVILSMSKYHFTSFRKLYIPINERTPKEFMDNNINEFLKYWIRHTVGYLNQIKRLNIHVIFYENLKFNFDNEVLKMANFLNLPMNKDEIDAIKSKVSFNDMKQDDPQHLRKGMVGEWVTEMSQSQKVKMTKPAKPLLKILNYSIDINRPNNGNEHLSLPYNIIDSRYGDRIIQQCTKRSFAEKVIRLYNLITK